MDKSKNSDEKIILGDENFNNQQNQIIQNEEEEDNEIIIELEIGNDKLYDNSSNEISIDEMPSTDMNQILYPLPPTETEEHGMNSNIYYYVDADNGDDNNDGLSTTTAFRTIQRAVNACYHECVIGENITPILLSGNTLKGSAWINPVYEAYALGEFIYNDCQVIINLVDFDSHNIEPVANILYTRINLNQIYFEPQALNFY